MGSLLRDQIGYLELQLAACRARPALHRHQIEAYEQQLALARDARDIAAFHRALVAAGGADATTRAEWMDRYANAAAMYRDMGDDLLRQMAEHNLNAARTAPPGRFLAAVLEAKRATTPRVIAAETARGAIPALVIALMEWATEGNEALRDDRRATAAGLWELVRSSDPACGWERVRTHAPYRRRIPFDDERLGVVEGWLREVVGEAAMAARDTDAAEARDMEDSAGADEELPAGTATTLASTDVGEAADVAVPTAEEAARGYHAAHEALAHGADPGVREAYSEVYAQVFAAEAAAGAGPTFLRMMAERGLFAAVARAPQLALARAGLARCAAVPQPHLTRHFRALEAALEVARTPTEIEHEVERLGARFAVESAWCDVLVRCATRPLAAALGSAADAAEHRRETVRRSRAMACTMFGRDWDALLDVPWVWELFRDVVYAQAQRVVHEDAPGGAHIGDVGLSVVEVARVATVWHGLELAEREGGGDPGGVARAGQPGEEPVFETPEAMRAYATELFERAVGETRVEPIAQPSLLLWDRPVAVDDALKHVSLAGQDS